MTFPVAKKIVYRKNPLDEVICQLRFPPILRIDTAVPADFQEQIRDQFPNFSEREELPLPIPSEMGKDLPTKVWRQLIPSPSRNYEFLSEDGYWKVNLTRTFMALSVKQRYTRARDFRNHLIAPLDALSNVYKPAYFSRIGLRYVDIIQRSVLGLDGCDWDTLLAPYALWMLGSPVVKDRIQAFASQCEIRLDDDAGVARIVMSLVSCQKGQQENEDCLKIDTDFYTTRRIAITDLWERLDCFHTEGLRLFRWMITERLHIAMDPEEVPND